MTHLLVYYIYIYIYRYIFIYVYIYIYIYVYTYVNWGMLSYQPAIPRGGGDILSTHPHAIGGPPRMVPYGAAYGVQRYRTV